MKDDSETIAKPYPMRLKFSECVAGYLKTNLWKFQLSGIRIIGQNCLRHSGVKKIWYPRESEPNTNFFVIQIFSNFESLLLNIWEIIPEIFSFLALRKGQLSTKSKNMYQFGLNALYYDLYPSLSVIVLVHAIIINTLFKDRT